MDEKNEVVKVNKSKNDNLEAKLELDKTKVDENKENLSDTHKNKGLSGFFIAVTVIYSLMAAYIVYIFGLLLLIGIINFDIKYILIGLVGLIITFLPYLLLFKVKSNKDKKLLNVIVVYELLSIIIIIAFFFFLLLPRIKDNINNQWCTMVDKDGNQVPC